MARTASCLQTAYEEEIMSLGWRCRMRTWVLRVPDQTPAAPSFHSQAVRGVVYPEAWGEAQGKLGPGLGRERRKAGKVALRERGNRLRKPTICTHCPGQEIIFQCGRDSLGLRFEG